MRKPEFNCMSNGVMTLSPAALSLDCEAEENVEKRE